MKINGSFKGTSFKFEDESPEALNSFIENGELFNQPNLLFLEEKYIDKCNQFSKVIDKFKRKNFYDDILIYKNNQLEELDDFSEEVELFNQIITENNINGLSRKDLNISVQHFENYEKTPKIDFVKGIYILLFLSNSTEYENNSFIFKVKLEEKETIKEVSFDNIESLDLVKIYSWIISSKENLQTRLKIVREIILRKGIFDLSDSDLYSAKSAFNRIIKEETDKYFAQVNMLKDDFLKLSERKQESYQSLHLKLLGWISAIALFIYDEIKDRESDKLLNKLFFSTTEKGNLFLVIFILSLIIIWVIFVKEMNGNKKEYEKIEEFYTKELFFEKEDFQKFIEKPEIPDAYKLIFFALLIALICRMFAFFIFNQNYIIKFILLCYI